MGGKYISIRSEDEEKFAKKLAELEAKAVEKAKAEEEAKLEDELEAEFEEEFEKEEEIGREDELGEENEEKIEEENEDINEDEIGGEWDEEGEKTRISPKELFRFRQIPLTDLVKCSCKNGQQGEEPENIFANKRRPARGKKRAPIDVWLASKRRCACRKPPSKRAVVDWFVSPQ